MNCGELEKRMGDVSEKCSENNEGSEEESVVEKDVGSAVERSGNKVNSSG